MVKRISAAGASRERGVRHADPSEHQIMMETAPRVDTSALAPSGRHGIVIIEKRALIRDCLQRCFRQASDLDVIAVADVEAWSRLATHSSTAMVILSLAGTSKDTEAQRDIDRLMRDFASVPTIILADGDELDRIVSLLDSGARGYIPTTLSLDVAIEAVRLVRAGGVFVPASSLSAARRQGEVAPAQMPCASGIFTARQAAVVDALRRGKANKVIAYELKMRESTVKVHVRNIMKKLNAKNRTEVAYLASGLLQEPSY